MKINTGGNTSTSNIGFPTLTSLNEEKAPENIDDIYEALLNLKGKKICECKKYIIPHEKKSCFNCSVNNLGNLKIYTNTSNTTNWRIATTDGTNVYTNQNKI